MGFDPFQWESFYFGNISRDEATRLLSANKVEVGTFIIRNSSHQGEYSLSVRECDEDPAVRHYLIQRIKNPDDGTTCIADNSFVDIPMLLNHYKMYLLDKTSLTTPYRREEIERVVALFRFEGERETDLNFEAGEELVIIEKTNDSEWWQARNALGITGTVPANYVSPINEHDRQLNGRSQSSYDSINGEERLSNVSSSSSGNDNTRFEPSLPAQAKVILDRQPNAYDATQLKIRKGQLLTVTKKMDNGQYEAALNGKTGFVPFTYIRFIPTTSV